MEYEIKNYYLHYHKKKEIGIKSNKMCTWSLWGKLWNWWNKSKESLWDIQWIGKTQYCEDVSSFQLDLYIQCNPNQDPDKLSCRYKQINFEFYMERQKTPKNQHNIENKVVGLMVLNFKTYCEVAVTKTLCYWQKNKHINI